MDEVALRRAILDDPDDDGLRLAYADWLEEHEQASRAEWIRASCEYARVPCGDERWKALWDRVFHSFGHCRPSWWESITSVDQQNDRGLYRFEVGAAGSGRGPAPVRRLDKVEWLGQAYAEGWLQRVEHLSADDEISTLLAKWKGPASQVPLVVRVAPQISDEGLRRILALPQLEGLELPAHACRNPVVAELEAFPQLRELTLELALVDGAVVDAVIVQLSGMSGLRRLHLKGHPRRESGDRPNDSDLEQLRGLAKLKRLFLSRCVVTDPAITELQIHQPDLIIQRDPSPTRTVVCPF